MRYILGVLVALGMLGAIFFFIFRGGSGGSQEPQRIDLNNYANTDATVQMIVEGPVVADPTHRSYQISVNRSGSTMQVFQGYGLGVTAERTIPNNQVAYTDFIKSLSKLNFTAIDPKKPTDERGYCPSGNRYIFRLVQGDKELMRGWTTSCGGNLGNFQGSTGNIRTLFQRQIPDYTNLIAGTTLS